LFQDAGAVDGIGHEAGYGRGAVHAGEDADVIARAGLAVGSAETLECSAGLRCQQLLLAPILRERIVALELGERAVVRVYVSARRYVLCCEADDLTELEDGLALGDCARRHLVPAHDARGCGHALRHHARLHAVYGHDDVVARVEPQRTRAVLLRPILHGASQWSTHDAGAVSKVQ
jgi:hypothetical protein